jgi:hypothetical protein
MPTAESVVRTFHPEQRSPDRRSHCRAPLDVPALIDNLKAWRPARCRDVSVTGIGIDCAECLSVGEQVDIYFELPNGFAIEARAQVVRASGRQMGLRFVALEPRARLAVRAHCRRAEAQ